MIHARIQEFSSGGRGVQVHLAYKKKLWKLFFQSSTYFTEVQWLLSKKTIICQGSSGVEHFPGGVQLFTGGSNCFFPIETHTTCDFPGGGGGPDPSPPSGSAHVFPRIVV